MLSEFKNEPLTDFARPNDKSAMEAALQAPTIDPAKIEQIRAEQMQIADQSSKVFTKALTDAGNVLSPTQRQAFFKTWSERQGRRHPAELGDVGARVDFHCSVFSRDV